MEKNWLIRTKNNHILGPVSKAKVQDLIMKGSIKGDDEVCSGNGYWIYIREQELVAKYIVDGEKQEFNPVSEAEPVGALSPNESDLEYPDMDDIIAKVNSSPETVYQKPKTPKVQNEPELSSSPSIADVAAELNMQVDNADDDYEDQEILPEEDDLEYPDELVVKAKISNEMGGMDTPPSPPTKPKPVPKAKPMPVPKPITKQDNTDKEKVVPIKSQSMNQKAKASVQAPKMKKRRKVPTPIPEVKKDSKISVKIIYLLVFLFLLMAIVAVMKREKIMNEINKRVSISIIAPAVAQDIPNTTKKKSGLAYQNLK